MASLNEQYLNRRGPTNVIAFPMQEGEYTDISPQLLGDVVISAETAQREGTTAGLTFQERFDQLLVHGILHLLGYDHEAGGPEAQEMEAQSEKLLAVIHPL
jgi:probable rRNA maturation factor